MERLRSDRLRACGRLIQKMVRGWLARQHYIKLQRTVRFVQTFGRGLLARRSVSKLLCFFLNLYYYQQKHCEPLLLDSQEFTMR